MRETLYELLGITSDASAKDIRATFLILAQQYHPDLHGSEFLSDARFKEIREAYEILHNPKSRAIYDNGLLAEFGDQVSPRTKSDFQVRNLRASTFSPIWLNDFQSAKQRLLLIGSGVLAGLALAFVCFLAMHDRSQQHQIASQPKPVRKSPSLTAVSTNNQQVQSSDSPEKFSDTLRQLKEKKEKANQAQKAKQFDEPSSIYPHGTSEFESIFQSTETVNASLPMFPSATKENHPTIGQESGSEFPIQTPETREPPTVVNRNSNPAISQSINQDFGVSPASHLASFDLQRSFWQTQMPTYFNLVPSQAELARQPLQPRLPTHPGALTTNRPRQFSTMSSRSYGSRPPSPAFSGVPILSNLNISAMPLPSNQRAYTRSYSSFSSTYDSSPSYESPRRYSSGSMIAPDVSPTTPILPSMILHHQ